MSPEGAEPFRYRRQGRNATALYVVGGLWFVLVALVVTVDAAPLLMGAIGLTTLPAIWEIWRNPASGLDVSEKALTWFSGRREGRIGWAEIDKVRLDTRLDFSVRATIVPRAGRKIRLPYECTPPSDAFESALHARGVRTERHHFSLIG